MAIAHLTEARVKSHTCPDGERQDELVDSARTGLYLLTTRNGSKTYMFRFKNPPTGKTAHLKIGRVDDISLTEARALIIEKRKIVASGDDPRIEKDELKKDITYGEFFKDHYMPFVRTRKRSASKDESLFRLRLEKTIGKSLLRNITRRQIQQIHSNIRAEGLSESSCDKYAQLIRHTLYLAQDWQFISSNPAARIGLYNPDNRVNNILTDEALKRFVHVLKNDKNISVCRVFQFLLFTGMRSGSVMALKWSAINFESNLITVEASTSKNKKAHSIPINQSAIKLLNEIERTGEFVFINPRTKTRYFHLRRSFYRLKKEANLPKEFRIHDIRHQAASMMIASGASLYSVGKVLSHASSKATERYTHFHNAELQQVSCAIDNKLESFQSASDEK